MNTPKEIRHTNVDKIINEALNLKEESYDERKSKNSQRDSGESEDTKPKHKVGLPNDTGESSSMGRDTNDLLDVEDKTGLSAKGEERTSSESNSTDSSVNGKQSDNGIRGENTRTEHEGTTTRDTNNGGTLDTSFEGEQQSIDFGGAKIDEEHNQSNDEERTLKEKQRARQRESDRIEEEQDTSLSPKEKIKLGAIKKQLPNLYYAQQKDVLFALNRFEVGKGVMFTNATGTGKTFTGLGIIKNFLEKGKGNSLIVVPSDVKCGDWVKDGAKVGLHIRQLRDIHDAGDGIVVTTYANFYQNKELLARANDLVMYDESQYIGQGQKGVAESYYEAHRQAVRLPSFVRAALWDKYPMPKANDYFKHTASTVEYTKAIKARQEKIRQETIKEVNSVNVVYLSATPFAYHKNIKYADGTLFDIEEKLQEAEDSWSGEYRGDDYGTYNQAVGFDSFLQSHFGYRMRYNKLTIPETTYLNNLIFSNF